MNFLCVCHDKDSLAELSHCPILAIGVCCKRLATHLRVQGLVRDPVCAPCRVFVFLTLLSPAKIPSSRPWTTSLLRAGCAFSQGPTLLTVVIVEATNGSRV